MGATATALLGFAAWYLPVSYTHLRAHETVLDLVCRLLLDKKNNQRHEQDELVASYRTTEQDSITA